MLTRRNTLRNMLIGSAALLSACAVSTVNGVTTVTLNLNTVAAYATAMNNGVNMMLSNALISNALGAANTAIVLTAVKDAAGAVLALQTANKGAVSLSFTTSSVPAAFTAFQQDETTIFNSLQTVVTSLGSSISGDLQMAFEAMQTVYTLAMALVSASGVGAPKTPMPESVALLVLGVTK